MKRGIQSQSSSDSSQSTASFLSSQHSCPDSLSEVQEQPFYSNREWKDIFPELIGSEPNHEQNHQLDVSRAPESKDATCFADIGGTSIETWMNIELDESFRNADSVVAGSQHDNVRDEELTCYGMVR